MSESEVKSDKSQLPAVVSDQRFQPIAMLGSDPADLHRYVTNFDGKGIEAARFITQALAKPGIRIDDVTGLVFHAKWYLAHVAEFVGDGGEMVPMPRMVLISKDGEVLSFVSEGGIRSMDLIRSLLGDGPWDPPLPLSVIQVRTRRGFKTYRIVLGESTNGSLRENVHSIRDDKAVADDVHQARDVSGGPQAARKPSRR